MCTHYNTIVSYQLDNVNTAQEICLDFGKTTRNGTSFLTN